MTTQRRATRRGRSHEGLILLASALVVIVGAAASQRATTSAPAASAATGLGMPPPLPSGAPMRAFEELPTDDERAAGCHFAERGFGDYSAWRKLPLGRALVPEGRAVAGDGTFRLLVHFHGAEPVRKELAPEGMDLVIAAVDAGAGSRAYERALAAPDSFDRLGASVEAEVAAASHVPSAHARAVVVSSWSAGYGAVTQILARGTKLAGVVLLDSLYAGYTTGRSLKRGQLATFIEAARAARGGGAAFYLTHTAIATPGYASTAEVASFLLTELGASAATTIDSAGTGERFPLTRVFEDGRLAIRGYAGNDRDAHCAQLHLLPSVLREAVLPTVD